MAPTALPQDLTKKFIDQFTSKLTSGGLVALLNSHIQQKDATANILQMDPSILELHIELLAYENAIRIACEFPTGLANNLVRQREKTPSSVQLDVSTSKKASSRATPVPAEQNADQFINGSLPKPDFYQIPSRPANPPIAPVINGETDRKISRRDTDLIANGNSSIVEPPTPPKSGSSRSDSQTTSRATKQGSKGSLSVI